MRVWKKEKEVYARGYERVTKGVGEGKGVENCEKEG